MTHIQAIGNSGFSGHAGTLAPKPNDFYDLRKAWDSLGPHNGEETPDRKAAIELLNRQTVTLLDVGSPLPAAILPDLLKATLSAGATAAPSAARILSEATENLATMTPLGFVNTINAVSATGTYYPAFVQEVARVCNAREKELVPDDRHLLPSIFRAFVDWNINAPEVNKLLKVYSAEISPAQPEDLTTVVEAARYCFEFGCMMYPQYQGLRNELLGRRCEYKGQQLAAIAPAVAYLFPTRAKEFLSKAVETLPPSEKCTREQLLLLCYANYLRRNSNKLPPVLFEAFVNRRDERTDRETPEMQFVAEVVKDSEPRVDTIKIERPFEFDKPLVTFSANDRKFAISIEDSARAWINRCVEQPLRGAFKLRAEGIRSHVGWNVIYIPRELVTQLNGEKIWALVNNDLRKICKFI